MPQISNLNPIRFSESSLVVVILCNHPAGCSACLRPFLELLSRHKFPLFLGEVEAQL